MSEKVYAISNVSGYATQLREAAAKSICDSSTDNLDDYISINQLVALVKEKCIGFDDKNRPMLNETINEDIFHITTNWIHDVGLAKLAAKDLVECAWDDESNQMIFWSKETHQDDKPKSKRRRKRKDI
jgi:hypothetical protein